MKVVQINATYGLGSTGTIVQNIHERLQKNQIESFVACSKTVEQNKEILKIGSITDRKIHALRSRIFGKQGYHSKIATKKLIKKLQKINPDIVHLHNLHSNFIHVDCLFSWLKSEQIPTVLTLHDCWFFTGKCCHYEAQGCVQWKTNCFDCPRNKKDVPSWIFDCTNQVFLHKKELYADMQELYAVPVSKWLERQVKQSMLKNARIHQIHNGVDLEIFYDRGQSWRNCYLPDVEFVILGMAEKWLDSRNEKTLQQVIAGLDISERLLLVGSSKRKLKKEYSKREYLKKESVKIIEFTSSKEEMAAIYSAADVFVNLTWEDSLPTVNIESLACGTPVITFDAGGSPETIDDETGIVVPVGNREALKRAILTVRKNKRAAYARACRQRASEYFEKNARYQEYIELYQNIMR